MALLPKHKDLQEMYARICPTLQRDDRDRMRRALSWLQRAEQCAAEDIDDRFLFLWISFSAAYGSDKRTGPRASGELELSKTFIATIHKYDHDHTLQQLMEARIGDSIKLLVTNQYVFQPFWDGRDTWAQEFAKQNRLLKRHYNNGNVPATFLRVLQRLHVLRNQIVHGGATWRSEVNRNQVKDGTYIMERLVPTVLKIMLRRLEKDPYVTWGKVAWPSADGAYESFSSA